jgi:putative tricarboxylic transport membrane protein
MEDGQAGRAAARQKSVEIVVAVLFLAMGALVIYDSVRLGATWGSDGPRPGYFPFYVGLIMCLSSAFTLIRAAFFGAAGSKDFVGVGQLKDVLAVLVPATVYVAVIAWTGIYVASAVFIALFMFWLGKYRWWLAAAVGIGTAAVFYVIFEIWFKVPLPKGPLENLLGLA